jgi:hypothetical protein
MSNSQPHRRDGFLIRLKANPDLVLACMNGKAALAWRNINDVSQLWWIDPMTTGNNNYQLINSLGGTLGVKDFGDGLVFGGESKGWNIPDGILTSAFQAIRAANNFDWNLNALRNGPYDVGNPVGVWDWSRGASNELWQISYLPDNPSFTEWRGVANHSLHCLAVQEGDMNGTLPLICDKTWTFPQRNERLVFAKIDWTQGFALRSKYNGKYVYWKGAQQQLGQSDTMTVQTLWTFQGRPEDRWGAIRAALDTNSNFNVLGAPKETFGAVVGTWGWSGGATNELWQAVQAYA